MRKLSGTFAELGFTLVEVMIAIGLFAVAGTAMMKTNEIAMKTNVAAQVGISWQLKRLQIEDSLQSIDGCENTLMGATYGGAIASIVSKNGTTIAAAATKYPSANNAEFEITSLTLNDITAGAGPYGPNTLAEIVALVTWQKNMAGKSKGSITSYKFPVEIAIVDAASPVTGCRGRDSSFTSTDACSMFQGDLIDISGSGDYRCINIDGMNGVGAIVAGATTLGEGAGDAQAATNLTAIGLNAAANATGLQPTAVGADALFGNTGDQNTAVGAGALSSSPSGGQNTAIGMNALFGGNSGSNNTAVGHTAMGANAVTGDNNTAMGYASLYGVTSGTDNIAIGQQSLVALETGSGNVGLGSLSMSANVIGDSNTALGYYALFSFNAAGGENTAVGSRSLQNNTTGLQNTSVGALSMQALTTGNYNTALGYQSLGTGAISGDSNVAVGWQAVSQLDAGANNIGIGNSTLDFLTDGSGNVAIGHGAINSGGSSMTDIVAVGRNAGAAVQDTSSGAVAIGALALSAGASGTDITAVGYSALTNLSTGIENTAIGSYSLTSTTAGNGNTAVGAYSLNANDGSGNTAVGLSAARSTTGDANTAVGGDSLFANSTGTWNTAIGYDALYANTTQFGSTAVGGLALASADGGQNTAIGYISQMNTTTGTFNTSMGFSSMEDNTTGSYNVAIGDYAMLDNIDAIDNTAVGYAAGGLNTSGEANTMIGRGAGYSNLSSWNTAVGMNAMYSLTGATNWSNTAIGAYAMEASTAASSTVAVGVNALRTNADGGYDNTFVGTQAGYNAGGAGFGANTAVGMNALYESSSVWNTAIGKGAGRSLTTGDRNVIIGGNAGYYQNTGTGNVYIGTDAGSNVGHTTGSGNVWIGQNAFYGANVSNTLLVELGPGQKIFAGIMHPVTVTYPTSFLYINTSVLLQRGVTTLPIYASAFNVFSDRRLKKNIRPYTKGLEEIMKLKIKKFQYKSNKNDDIGVIAQDLQKVMPDAVSMGGSGDPEKDLEDSTNPDKKRDGYLAINTNYVLFTLVNAVQEQQEQFDKNNEMFELMKNGIEKRLDQHDKDIAKLQNENIELKRELAELRQIVNKLNRQK